MNLVAPIIAGLIFAGVTWQVVSHLGKLFRMKRRDYEWYRREFPEHVNNGRVTCYKCGSNGVGTERLMNQTNMLCHLCRTCGTALYYSPES